MPDCASASIVIGGRVSADDFVTLCRLIANEGLCTEEDGEEFSPELRIESQPLRLFDHQAIGGRFGSLEAWCEYRGIPFTRTCAGYPGAWRAERVVFTGRSPIEEYPADEDGNAVATRKTVEAHEHISTLRAWFAAAEFEVPPLVVIVGDETSPGTITRASSGQEESEGGDGEHCSQLQKGSAT